MEKDTSSTMRRAGRSAVLKDSTENISFKKAPSGIGAADGAATMDYIPCRTHRGRSPPGPAPLISGGIAITLWMPAIAAAPLLQRLRPPADTRTRRGRRHTHNDTPASLQDPMLPSRRTATRPLPGIALKQQIKGIIMHSEATPPGQLSAQDFERIRNLAHRKEYRKDETIFSDGDSADYIYFIEDGHTYIFIDKFTSREEVSTMGAGEYFGEMAFFSGDRRSASAAALLDSTLLLLERNTFLSLFESDQELAAKINGNFARRNRELAARRRWAAGTAAARRRTCWETDCARRWRNGSRSAASRSRAPFPGSRICG